MSEHDAFVAEFLALAKALDAREAALAAVQLQVRRLAASVNALRRQTRQAGRPAFY